MYMQIEQTEYCKPQGSKFFYGETVRHTGDGEFYTVCDLSNCEQNYYGLWPLGYSCAVPTHGSSGDYLESISQTIEPLNQKQICYSEVNQPQ